MQFASLEFRDQVRSDATVLAAVQATQQTSSSDLDVLTGSVVYDWDDATRSSLDLTIEDTDNLAFHDMESLIDPFISTFIAQRGLALTSGATELITLGTYYADEAHLQGDVSGAPTWSIRAFDASGICQDHYDEPVYIAPGTPFNEAIPRILLPKLSSIEFSIPSTPWGVPLTLLSIDSDPWAEARRLAMASGYDLYFSRSNQCTARPATTSEQLAPVWEYHDGANCEFFEPHRDLNAGSFPNVVVVQGTNPATANVIGIARDVDPLSKTYVGNFTRVRTFSSELVTSSEQATAMASYLLSKLLGPQDEVGMMTVPNPLIDVGDLVAATCTKIGLDHALLMVSHIELPLHVEDAMQVTLRRQVFTDTTLGSPVRQ